MKVSTNPIRSVVGSRTSLDFEQHRACNTFPPTTSSRLLSEIFFLSLNAKNHRERMHVMTPKNQIKIIQNKYCKSKFSNYPGIHFTRIDCQRKKIHARSGWQLNIHPQENPVALLSLRLPLKKCLRIAATPRNPCSNKCFDFFPHPPATPTPGPPVLPSVKHPTLLCQIGGPTKHSVTLVCTPLCR